MKNKIFKIIIVLVILLQAPAHVLATRNNTTISGEPEEPTEPLVESDVTGQQDGGTSNLRSGKCNGTCYYGEFGLRITVVDVNGKRMSDTQDYVNSGISDNVYYFPGKKTKTEYIGRSSLGHGELAYGKYDYNLISSTLKSLPLFLNYSNGAAMLKRYFERMPIVKINNLFDDLGYERGDYEAFAEAGDFIMVEPLAFVEWKYNYYGGTATELALLWDRTDVTAAATGGLGISNLTHGNLPWSVYIENDHFNAPNTLKGQGANTSWSILSRNQIIGNNGMGVGLFWKFLDYGEEDPYCAGVVCDDLRTTDNPDICEETGFYQDPTNWCCIKTAKYQKEEFTYCNTYCREEVQTNFPDSHLLVKAGTHFTFDSVGRIESTAQCRKYIEFDKWYENYKTANNNVQTTYNTWQRQKKVSEAWNKAWIDTITETTYSCQCYNKYAGTISYNSGSSSCSNQNCTGTPRRTGTDERYTFTINFPTVYWAGENVTPAAISYNARGEANNALQSGQRSNQSLIETYQGNYNSAVAKRTQLKTALSGCQTINPDNIVGEKTTAGKLQLFYNYAIIENDYRNIDLKVENVVDKGVDVGETNAYPQKNLGKTIRDFECEGSSKCTSTNTKPYNPKSYTSVYRELYTTTTYKLDDDTYRYVLKSPGKDYGRSIYKEADVSDTIKENGLYYKIEYANLPVHYSLAEGNYDYYIKYSSIGAVSSFTKYINEANPTTYDNSPAYQCSYGVYNEITKYDPGTKKWYGLNVIYRPIDLDNAFPGKSGKDVGRISGVNWRYGVLRHDATVTSYDRTLVDYYITNNRGVKTEEVYQKEPMYEIVLTPSLIKEIRRYNDEQEKGYADFNLTCINGRKCQSDFIRNSNISDYITGCGTKTWDQCDNEDSHPRNK